MEPEHVAFSVGLDELQREFDTAVMSIMDSLTWKSGSRNVEVGSEGNGVG